MRMFRLLIISFFWITASSSGAVNQGRLDTGFTPSAPNGPVHAVLPLPNGSVIIGGQFTHIGGVPQAYLAKYLANGSLDPDFHPVLDGAVEVIEAGLRGGYYVGGHFNTVNGTNSGKLALIKNSGTLDTTFPVGIGFDGPVYAVKENLAGSSTLLVGGAFNNFRDSKNLSKQAQNLALIDNRALLMRHYAVNGPVKALAQHFFINQPEFVFGGEFTLANGIPVSNLAIGSGSGIVSRLAGTDGEVTKLTFGTCSTTFLNYKVPTLIIGGNFSTFANSPSAGLAAIVSGTSSGGGTVSFATSVANNPSALMVDSDSRLIACNQDGGIWRFSPLTASNNGPTTPGPIVSPWSASSDFTPAPHANGKIHAIAQESQLRYYIGGDFTTVDGQAVPYFARLHGPQGSGPPAAPVITKTFSTDDRVIARVNPIDYALGYDLEISGDGGISWLGGFSASRNGYGNIPGTGLRPSAAYLARVRARNTNGPGPFSEGYNFSTKPPRRSGPAIYMSLPGDWAQGDSEVDDLFLDASGRLAIVGPNDFAGNLFGGFAVLDDRFEIDFSLNTTNNPRAMFAAAIPDGGYIICTANELPLSKLDATGAPVSAFAPAYNPNYRLEDMVVQADGKIILAGRMRITDGAPSNGIVRLEAGGAIDTGFDPLILSGTNAGEVMEVTLLPGNRLLLVGDFTSIDGIPCNDIAILDSTGAVDTSFTTGIDSQYWNVYSAAPDPQGRIVIAGDLGNDGDARVGVRRLLADGSIDPAWQSVVFKDEYGNSSSINGKVAVQPDGKVIIGDNFHTVNDRQTRNIARLNVDGTLDTSFDAGLGSDGYINVNALLVMPDSSIAVAGSFKMFDGEVREGFVLLRGDQTPSDFSLWLNAHDLPPLSSPTADDDGDGRPLAMEFAYNSNPHASDGSPVQTSGAGFARLNPITRRGIKGTGYFSSNLSSWEPVPIQPDWTIRPPAGTGNNPGFFRFGLELGTVPE